MYHTTLHCFKTQALHFKGQFSYPEANCFSELSPHIKQRSEHPFAKHISSSQWHIALNSWSCRQRLLKEKIQLVLTQADWVGKRKRNTAQVEYVIKYTFTSKEKKHEKLNTQASFLKITSYRHSWSMKSNCAQSAEAIAVLSDEIVRVDVLCWL